MRVSSSFRPVVAWFVLLPVLAPAWAERPAQELEIEPGPATISAEERAIVADPAAGIENAVILREETDRDDTLLGTSQVRYHLRAKVLSNEGRDIADITLPFNARESRVKNWWARTLLPDGTVLELRADALTAQHVSEHDGRTVEVMKGALPGVVPGAIIDYGYDVRSQSAPWAVPVMLQRSRLVKSFRLRWSPSRALAASFQVLNGEGLDIDVERGPAAVVITARNLRPVLDEPLAPPAFMTRAWVLIYYTGETADPPRFWNATADRLQRATSSFLSRGATKDLLAAIDAPQGGDLDAKLRAAYAWVDANIRNEYLRTAEEEEQADEDEDDRKNTLSAVLAAKSGTTQQIARAFIGAARAYGAEATLVLAPDRTDNYFRPQLLTVSQVPWRLVAVRAPGGEWTLVAPGYGLPYGELPYWVTGVTGLLVDGKKGQTIQIPVSMPERNQLSTQAKIRFDDDNATVSVDWGATGSGNVGYLERREMRGRTPEQRTKRLDELCGAGWTSFEVTRAEAPDMQDFAKPWSLRCAGELVGSEVDEGAASYSLVLQGPWIPALPDLTAPARTLPVVFDFMRLETTVVEIGAPSGFTPAVPPASVVLSSPFGDYSRIVEQTAGGFRVERSFKRAAIMLKPESYAGFRKWLSDIRRADMQPVVFRRGEAK